jgi:hypothetical protein
LKSNSGTNENFQNEIVHKLKAVMEQNYFSIPTDILQTNNGLAMDVPATAILAEAHIENTKRKQKHRILMKRQITGYFSYVDDILLICDQRKTNIEETLNEFNKQQTTIKFAIENELHSSIIFVNP